MKTKGDKMNLRYNVSASANLEALLTSFMNQNQISAYDMRNFLNNFMIKLNDAVQIQLLLEIQEEELKQQQQEEQSIEEE